MRRHLHERGSPTRGVAAWKEHGIPRRVPDGESEAQFSASAASRAVGHRWCLKQRSLLSDVVGPRSRWPALWPSSAIGAEIFWRNYHRVGTGTGYSRRMYLLRYRREGEWRVVIIANAYSVAHARILAA